MATAIEVQSEADKPFEVAKCLTANIDGFSSFPVQLADRPFLVSLLRYFFGYVETMLGDVSPRNAELDGLQDLQSKFPFG